ncbi:ribose-5-phosphate isomerase A, partial [Bacteroides ovatus]
MDWKNHLIKHLQWSDSIINREAKEHVAREIAATAKDGDVIGAGSGSTVYLTLFELSRRIREEHLHIEVIPASQEISMTCIQLGIPQTTLWNKRPNWTFDGADEVDPQQNLIKGRGGAMFKEKLLIRSSRKTFIIIDPSKRVNQMGSRVPIPVEVFPGS